MTNPAKTIYEYTRYVWVLLALASLILQASRTTEAGEAHSQVLYYGELGITIAFDVEIGLRVLATLPDWRDFFRHGQNWLDTAIAVVSTIIQIPAIHNSALYPWFTIVQLMRFYRVILVVPRMKPLLVRGQAISSDKKRLTHLVARCIRKHVWFGEHDVVSHPGQLHCGTIRASAAARRRTRR